MKSFLGAVDATGECNNNDSDDDDTTIANDLTTAFQQFMLQGKGSAPMSPLVATSLSSSSKKKKRQSQTSTGTPRGGSNNICSPTAKKSLQPILRAFQGRLDDWNYADTQLQTVLHSIWNLRSRLAWESKQLQQELEQTQQQQQQSSWQGCGFHNSRASCSSFLLPKDVHMALDHDVLQHERMLSALRKLMASLAQALEALGRRLDEWTMLLMAMVEEEDEGTRLEAQEALLLLLEDAQQLYHLLAQELYCKQTAAQKVLDSSIHDEILFSDPNAAADDGGGKTTTTTAPREIAKRAWKEWSSVSDDGDIKQQKRVLMDRLQKADR